MTKNTFWARLQSKLQGFFVTASILTRGKKNPLNFHDRQSCWAKKGGDSSYPFSRLPFHLPPNNVIACKKTSFVRVPMYYLVQSLPTYYFPSLSHICKLFLRAFFSQKATNDLDSIWTLRSRSDINNFHPPPWFLQQNLVMPFMEWIEVNVN